MPCGAQALESALARRFCNSAGAIHGTQPSDLTHLAMGSRRCALPFTPPAIGFAWDIANCLPEAPSPGTRREWRFDTGRQ